MVCCYLILFITVLYILYDVNYFLRTAFTVLCGKIFGKEINIDDVSTIYGICTFQDCDLLFKKMRIARLIREIDFARYHFYERTGILKRSAENQISSLQRSTMTVSLENLVFWNARSLFFEHEVTTLRDNKKRCLLISRQYAIGDMTNPVAKLLLGLPGSNKTMECPKNIKSWLDGMKISSFNLRNMSYTMFCVITTIVLLLYVFWDVNYFLRVAFTIGVGRLFNKKSGLKDPTTIYGFCTTQDVDIFLRHMNNARYVRELDFARFHFYDRTGIYDNIKAVDGHVLQGASSIRYRRTIPIFSAYKVETKLVYWEDKTIYLEQKFITISDGFVRAVVLSRQSLVNIDSETLLKNVSGAETKPECPEEIKHWLQAIEVSSAKLRKKD
ncbi:unnamed protein product [Leptidea sinapis]|uniref:Protein THEM6 n=2 Tax=Leptidea sinapis TaxID=189913 RepID=A0A5E4QX92_9NEOP|nr:unnamed protein product [Leptidea sinapis]